MHITSLSNMMLRLTISSYENTPSYMKRRGRKRSFVFACLVIIVMNEWMFFSFVNFFLLLSEYILFKHFFFISFYCPFTYIMMISKRKREEKKWIFPVHRNVSWIHKKSGEQKKKKTRNGKKIFWYMCIECKLKL